MKNSCLVYLFEFPDNKYYVGITTRNLDIRVKEHSISFNKRSSKIAKAIKKVNFNNIKIIILKENISLSLAKKYEIYYIKKYNSFNNGYNSTLGGEGLFGHKMTKEHKEKISKAKQGIKMSEEFKSKHSVLLKNFYKNNPKKVKKQVLNLKKYREENKELFLKLQKEGLNKYEVRLKKSRKNGGKPILVYNLQDIFIGRWEILSDCARELNLQTSKICLCLQGKRNKHRGYKFKYEKL